jgi:hypothetical protein
MLQIAALQAQMALLSAKNIQHQFSKANSFFGLWE